MTRDGGTSLAQAARALADAVEGLLRQPNSAGGPQRIRRVEQAIPPMDVIAWLEGRQSAVRWFWSDRENAFMSAAIGAAWRSSIETAGELAPMLAGIDELFRDAGVRVYGGMRFDGARPASAAWRAFGAAQFFVPRVELREDRGRCTIACHVNLPGDAQRPEAGAAIAQEIRAAAETGPAAPAFEPTLLRRVDRPDSAGWAAGVSACLDAFAREAAEKIVLARQTDFYTAEPVPPLSLLRSLQRGTPNSYHYFYQPEPGVAFLGASPERLYRRQGRGLETEALAGTRPRGATPAEDEQLGRELLQSDKEQREHAHVSRTIRLVLRGLCERVDDSAPRLSRLGHCQHVLTPIRAALKIGASDADLLQGLHPTPAVGGVPREEALASIRALEPFDRGWYTGPIGWIGADAAEFAVAIRSALVREECVSVFTGNGIVPGSEPEEEWLELESKLADFRSVLEGAAAESGSGRS
jgi:menaquinone-specific isochorismate synthase